MILLSSSSCPTSISSRSLSLRALVSRSHRPTSASSLHFPPPLRRFSSSACFARQPNTNPLAGTSVDLFSSVSPPPGQELEWKDASFSPDPSDGYQQHLLELQQEKQTRVVPVRAYFLCTRFLPPLSLLFLFTSYFFPFCDSEKSIDLRSLQNQNSVNVVPPNSRATTNYTVLRYCDTNCEPQVLEASFGGGVNCCFMVVFQYGSIVLFNVSDHEVDGYLKIVEKHASGLLSEMRKDGKLSLQVGLDFRYLDYAVLEKPSLETWMQGGPDYIVLKNLNIDGIRTIGSVLGQSIALDYYIRQVDGMVAEFTDINRGMEKTGTFTMKRKKLFQLVGKANSNLADVILKLGLFER
ncbi:hypothetical protein ACLOJK_011944 [Asimina triloba]